MTALIENEQSVIAPEIDVECERAGLHQTLAAAKAALELLRPAAVIGCLEGVARPEIVAVTLSDWCDEGRCS
jgi:hypothetical protein